MSVIEKDSEGKPLPSSNIEGLYRVAIHTGYYACLNKIRQINELKNISTKHGGNNSHNDIIESIREYEEISDKTRLIQLMKTLKEYRRKADYEDGNANIYTNAGVNRILNNCEKAFNILKSI